MRRLWTTPGSGSSHCRRIAPSCPPSLPRTTRPSRNMQHSAAQQPRRPAGREARCSGNYVQEDYHRLLCCSPGLHSRACVICLRLPWQAQRDASQLAGHWVHRDLVRDVLKSVCVLAVQHTPRPPPTHSSGTLWRSRHTPDTARGSWPGTRTHTALTLFFLGLNLTCACHAKSHMLCMPDHNHWLPT